MRRQVPVVSGPARSEKDQGDQGAILVLALFFLVVMSLIITGLLAWTQNDLINVAHFKSQRTLQYSAGGAVQVAMENVRYNYSAPSASPQSCPGTTPSISIDPNGPAIAVWCFTVWQPFSLNTRIVTFLACAATTSESACSANPALQAVANFDDYTGVVVANSSPCTVTCGASASVKQWVFNPQRIVQASPTSGSVAAGSSATYTNQLNVTGNSGAVTYATSYTSQAGLMVSSSGHITTTGTLSSGTYTISGTDQDANNHVGVFTFTLAVS
jgi:hypothetical protein